MDRVCCVEGCKNLGAWNSIRSGKLYRSSMCCKHKRIHYGQPTWKRRKQLNKNEFRNKNGNKCMLCGWVGPCDVHRKIPNSKGGKYTEENSILICPNCHRLQHPEVFPMR